MATWAIIPVKRLSEAKSSLKSILTPEQRREFVLCMLDDVLSAVKHARSVADVLVVSPDDEVLSFASSKGAVAVSDADVGLNSALKIAIARAKKAGARNVLILPADVPLLSPSDVEEIIGLASGERDVVIASSKRKGTNALLLRPPDVIDMCFGGESFPAHLEEARRAGVVPRVYRSERVATDIDEAPDLVKLEARGLGTKSRDFLKSLEQG